MVILWLWVCDSWWSGTKPSHSILMVLWHYISLKHHWVQSIKKTLIICSHLLQMDYRSIHRPQIQNARQTNKPQTGTVMCAMRCYGYKECIDIIYCTGDIHLFLGICECVFYHFLVVKYRTMTNLYSIDFLFYCHDLNWSLIWVLCIGSNKEL